MRSTNPNHLERWLGKGVVEDLATNMRDWYGPPIAVAGVPGRVYATKGDFIGECRYGAEATWLDYGRDILKRLERRTRLTPALRSYMNVGFSTFTALRLAGLNGTRRTFPFNCTSISASMTGVNRASSQWLSGPIPPAGSAASAAAGGRVPVGDTNGGFLLGAAPTGMNWYFVSGACMGIGSSALGNTGSLMLYDRLFDVAKTMNSTATESVTGTPSRYQNATASNPAYIGGNFMFPEIFTTLANTAHNWATMKYTKEDNTTVQSLPSLTGVAQGGNGMMDMTSGQWFAPLVAGDLGVANITQMQLSASLASGAINWVIGHPIAWMPGPLHNALCDAGGITTSFNFCRIFDNACLSFIEPPRNASGTQVSYTGSFDVVAG